NARALSARHALMAMGAPATTAAATISTGANAPNEAPVHAPRRAAANDAMMRVPATTGTRHRRAAQRSSQLTGLPTAAAGSHRRCLGAVPGASDGPFDVGDGDLRQVVFDVDASRRELDGRRC